MIDIQMPEATHEGTEASISRWLKQIGDTVIAHEPLIEISTDKVTIEIAAPASGILREMLQSAGDAVATGSVLGRIEPSDVDVSGQSVTTSNDKQKDARPAVCGNREDTYSPAVRKLLLEHDLDAAQIPKTSRGGRLTPEDVAAHLAERSAAADSRRVESKTAGHKVPHTPMRKSIASHMARSVQTAPHVTAVFEADLYEVLADREDRKQRNAEGEAPSVTAYLIHAAVQAMRIVPEVNSRWHDEFVEVFDWIHFGVGTALESGGLVVPVLRDVQTMGLLALSHELREMTKKARSGKLTHADMADGTFTLSNHGVSGSLLAAPIILPHGQAAILGAGKLQKRVIVCETGGRELFRVRPMMYVTLTVDHRVLDGQQTNAFMTAFVSALETSWTETQ